MEVSFIRKDIRESFGEFGFVEHLIAVAALRELQPNKIMKKKKTRQARSSTKGRAKLKHDPMKDISIYSQQQ